MNFLLNHGSYAAIIVVLVLTGTGLPIPEEVPIVAAGLLSAAEKLNPYWAFAACLFGAIVGDCVMYGIGYHFGRSVVREHPWWAHLVSPEREATIERMLKRHGLKVFFLARFLVGIRSPVYLSAGILHVPFRRFFLIDLFCATSVIGVFFSLSYFFGRRYGTKIAVWIREAEFTLTGVVLVAGLIAGIVYFCRRRRAKKVEQEAAEETSAISGGQIE